MMKVYSVHEPRKLTGDPARDAERFVFVRDCFHFWAFVLGPLWMLWRRLWLVLLIYLVLTTAIQLGLWAIGVSGAVRFAVGVLIALLVGFEAGTLRRWTLRKWRNLGVVVGRDQEDAERRFFDAWVKHELPQAPTGFAQLAGNPAPMPATRMPTAATPEVIGLFPEPEPRPRT
jgi:hypothetical protein